LRFLNQGVFFMATQLSPSIPRLARPQAAYDKTPAYSPPDTRDVRGNGLARFLGYFSIGLGAAEALAPDTMARLTGVRQESLLQAYGAREIASGIGILAESRPAGWLWARVVGDVLDLVLLGENLAEGDADRRARLIASTLAVGGVAVLDVICAAQLSASARSIDH
jgi:hypothetical protein